MCIDKMPLQLHQFITADCQSSVFAADFHLHKCPFSQSRIFVDLSMNLLGYACRKHAGCERAVVEAVQIRVVL